MAKPRVLVLGFSRVADDPRMLRHVRALQAEFEVVTCGRGGPVPGVPEHHELPSDADHLPLSPAGLTMLATRRSGRAYDVIPAVRGARTILPGVRFDALFTTNILTVPLAIDVAGARPVLADLYEYHPREMSEDVRWRLLIQPFMESLCRDYLPRVQAVTTVSDGIAEEYRNRFGVRVWTVNNAGPYRHPQPTATGRPIRLVHSGMATPNRRIDRMIKAVAGIDAVTLDLFLVPALRHARHLGELATMAAQTPNVRVRPAVPMAELPATLDQFDVGVFDLPPTNFNYLHALPNKFFDFVQSGLAVIIGPSPDMARIVSECGLGLVLPDFSQAALSEALKALSAEQVDRWKAAGCAAAGQLSCDDSDRLLRALMWRILDDR